MQTNVGGWTPGSYENGYAPILSLEKDFVRLLSPHVSHTHMSLIYPVLKFHLLRSRSSRHARVARPL